MMTGCISAVEVRQVRIKGRLSSVLERATGTLC